MHKSMRFWDRMASSYDNDGNDRFDPALLKNTREYLKPGDVVLDFGCATGSLTLQFAGCVKEIHGVDYSANMIEVASAKATEINAENATFMQADVLDANIGPETYDVILAFNLLHLVKDIHAVTRKINEALKPGGLFISLTPCRGEKGRWLRMLMAVLGTLGITPRPRFFETSELEQILTGAGFEIVRTECTDQAIATDFFAVVRKLS